MHSAGAAYLTLVAVVAAAWGLVEFAAVVKRRRLKPVFTSPHAAALRRRQSASGIIIGLMSCLFGALGILTYGLLFAPLGGVTGAFALLHALGSHTRLGVGLATFGLLLTLTAVMSSPSLWDATGPYAQQAITQAQVLSAKAMEAARRATRQ